MGAYVRHLVPVPLEDHTHQQIIVLSLDKTRVRKECNGLFPHPKHERTKLRILHRNRRFHIQGHNYKYTI